MHLWNDYEGTTVAGQWTLGRLLRTEGRSALFATAGSDGKAAVLRLTEALNDQAALGARYRAIQAAGDRFLVKVDGYGDAELDGAPLSYAVLEPTQESLADILSGRRLAPEEVQEVATVVAGGLHALHGQGLVHGLVEPESVLAAGDQIKLRSDCARWAPAPEDADLEGAITPQTDAWGLAAVIYRSLTGNRLHDSSDALALPEPFATIVRNTAWGAWGVPEIEAELARAGRAHAAPVAPAAEASGRAQSSPAPSPVTPPASVESVAAIGAGPEPSAPKSVSSRAAIAPPAEEQRAWQQPERVSGPNRRNVWLGVGAAVLLVLAIAVLLFFHHRANRTAAAPEQANTVAETPETAPAPPEPKPDAAPAPAQPEAKTDAGTAAQGTRIWRVVAYTYNRQDEAAAKAAALNRRFPKFNAEVWSRTGQRPFLVTLGGPMLKEQAVELRGLARHAGVARDVYAQNYAR